MKKCFTTFLLLLGMFGTLTMAWAQPSFEGRRIWDKPLELNEQFTQYEIYELNATALYQWALEDGAPTFSLQLGTRSWNLNMVPSEIQAKNYTVRVADEQGVRNVQPAAILPLMGDYGGDSHARLTLFEDFIYGYMENEQASVFIEPLRYFVPDAPPNQFVVYDARHVIPKKGNLCAAEEMEQQKQKQQKHEAPQMFGFQSNTCKEVEIAIASDFLMFQKYGSISGVEAQTSGVMNNVQGDYSTAFDDELLFVIVEQFVSVCSNCDPWTSSNNAGALLNSFTNWGPNGFAQVHDVGQLWTDRNFNGFTIGIAWVAAICNNNRYHCNSDFSNNATLLRVLTSHELGHNFACTHDPQGSPFIMAPAVQFTNQWSTMSENQVNGFLPSRFCLSPCVPASPPTADFVANKTQVCTGEAVNFTNLSTNFSSLNWSFPGGTPASSTQENPTVVYNNPGVYTVTLTATNAAGSDTETKVNYIEVAAPPVAAFTSFTVGLEVNFTDLSTGATSWLWEFGDGTTSTQQNPVKTYQSGGVYNVTLIVSNFCSTNQITLPVFVESVPTANFEADPAFGCDPFTVTFNNQSTSNATSFKWFFEGGAPATSTQKSPTVTYGSPGIYDVTLIATNLSGSDTLVKQDYIEVFAQQTADFDFQVFTDSVQFSNLSINANGYDWDFGDGAGSTQTNPSHIYDNSGSYTVTLIAEGDCGFDTTSKVVDVFIGAEAGFFSDSISGCLPLTVTYTDTTSAEADSIQWLFEGGSPAQSTDSIVTVTYNSGGLFDVTLIAYSSQGNDTLLKENYVQVLEAPQAGFTDSISGLTVFFTNTSTGANQYLWQFGDDSTSTMENPGHTYSADNEYELVLIATGPCGIDTFTQTLTVGSLPTAGIGAAPLSGCLPLDVQFTNLSSANATSVEWFFEEGAPATSSENDPLVTYSSAGIFDVTLVATNALGSDTLSWQDTIEVREGPTAQFGTSMDGLVLTTDNQSVNADSVFWDFGDGDVSTDLNPVHTYDNPGDYTVTLIVINGCGSDTATQVVTALLTPVAGFTADTTTGCVPFSVQFTDQTTQNPDTWEWIFEGGSPSTSTDQNPVVTYNAAGTFDVTLIVTNALGADTLIQSDFISVGEVPEAGFTATVSGLEASFTNTSAGANAYEWNFGDGNTSTASDPVHTYAMDGVYTVQLIASNDCGSDTVSQQVTIITPPVAAIFAAVDSGCAPATLTFESQSSSNSTSLAWTFEGGDPAASVENMPTVTFANAGSFLVTLIASNAAGSDTATLSVEIGAGPIAGFTSSVDDLTVSLTNTANGENTINWWFGDGQTSAEENPEYTYAADGFYEITQVVTNDCGVDTLKQTITVGSLPTAGFSQDVNSGCVPLAVSFENTSSANATQLQWFFEGGSPATSTENNPVVTYDQPGTYDVMLVATNALGSDTTMLTDAVEVLEAPVAGFGLSQNGSTVTFTDASTGADTYDWDFGDGMGSAMSDPMHTYADPGTYVVSLTVTNPCGTDTFTDTVEILSLPTASFKADNTFGCGPLTVTFTDLSTENITEWMWVFEGGTPDTSFEQNPIVEYDIPGLYDVTLKVTNAAGSTEITEIGYVEVFPDPIGGFNSTVSMDTVFFQNTSTHAGSYFWNFGDGQTSNEESPTHVYDMDGTYTVRMWAINNCDTAEVTQIITIATPPSAGFLYDPPVGCTPLEVDFTNTSSENATDFEWTFTGPETLTSSEEDPTVVFTEAGVYDIQLIASNANGADTIFTTAAFEVFPLPVAGYTATSNDLTLNFTSTSAHAGSFEWRFGDGNGSVAENPSHTYDNPGVYEVMLIVGNGCGSDTLIQEIQVPSNGAPPQAGFESSMLMGCGPLSVDFTDVSTNNPTNWTWTFEGAVPGSSNEQNPTVEYSASGTYQVTLIAGNVFGSDTFNMSMNVTILPIPGSDFSYSNSGGTVTFNNQSDNAIDYLWLFGNGDSSTEVNPEYTYDSTGTYEVALIASNDCGSDTMTQTVQVTVTSTRDLPGLEYLKVYPNPSNGLFTLEMAGAPLPDLQLELYNTLGQRLDNRALSMQGGYLNTILDYRNLPAGQYMLRLQSGENLQYQSLVIMR